MEAPPADRIIVALDGMEGPQALAFTAAMPELRWVKVGLELFTAAGPQVVHQLREQGKRAAQGPGGGGSRWASRAHPAGRHRAHQLEARPIRR